MKKSSFTRILPLLLAAALIAKAGDTNDEKKMVVRAVVDLTDGSKLNGTPTVPSLPVNLEFGKMSIPLDRIKQFDVRHQDERIVLTLQNGDKMTGTLDLARFELDTILGRLTPDFSQINRISLSSFREGALPPGEGPIPFGGVNWLPWHLEFEIQGDKLVALPKVRPGFNYGHEKNGRGPYLMSNIGNKDWRDYSVETELCMTGVDPSFNPYGLPTDTRGAAIHFHVADAKESFNEKGTSCYTFSIGSDGAWNLSCAYNSYCNVPMGWATPTQDANRKLADGTGLKTDRVNGNKIRIDVRGERIQIWCDGQQLADLTDEHMNDEIGGQTLDHGGVGFQWGFEGLGWIRNFSVKRL